MADGTKIEWTDATVNAVDGCSVLSPGCKLCYAMKQAHRVDARRGLTRMTAGGMVWTGEVRFNEKQLLQPLAWKRARRIFWNAHGDLFHESVPDAWIDKVFAVFALTPQHSHQILTKRSARMREYCAARSTQARVLDAMDALLTRGSSAWPGWPLPNVWAGVSVEDQARRERVLDLAQTPAAIRFTSGEPLLERITLTDIPLNGGADEHGIQWLFNALTGEQYFIGDDGFTYGGDGPDMKPLDWVIVGGESGPGARPMHPDWARSLRDQCASAGVPMLFKQWGEWKPLDENGNGFWPSNEGGCIRLTADGERNQFGWPLQRVGKKVAGRLLDDVQHDGIPA